MGNTLNWRLPTGVCRVVSGIWLRQSAFFPKVYPSEIEILRQQSCTNPWKTFIESSMSFSSRPVRITSRVISKLRRQEQLDGRPGFTEVGGRHAELAGEGTCETLVRVEDKIEGDIYDPARHRLERRSRGGKTTEPDVLERRLARNLLEQPGCMPP